MAVVEVHPSAEELAAFTLGTLGDDAHTSIEAHVTACTSCQERAAVAPGDILIELLRCAHARTGRQADTVTQALAQIQTPAPLAADAEAVTIAPAVAPGAPTESDRPEVPDAVLPALARHDRYRVVRLLGEGGMGAVYEAEHRVMQRPVALKVINRAYTANAAAVERFRREVRAAARLSHPNIVTTYDAEDAGDTQFLVMEYVEGVSLGRLVKEHGQLPVAEACAYVRQAALGLQHAHERGMVHRDVKPDNLIRCADGTVKVLDFGLAVLTAERGGGLTDTNVVMGTPDYMAPEQAEDASTADIRADVYSLGCTLYHLLAGRVPYPAATSLLKILAHREQPIPPVRQARPEVPAGLAGVLARMLAKKPEGRFPTPGEVAVALEPFTCPRPSDVSDTIAAPFGDWLRRPRHRLLVAALAALLLVGMVIAGAVGVYRIQTDKGELVITTESDDFEVVIKQGGRVVTILDPKSKQKVTLDTGDYTVSLTGNADGLNIDMPETFTLRRGERKVVTIKRVTRPDPAAVKPPAEQRVGEVRRFEGPKEAINRVALSSDGRFMVSTSGHYSGDWRGAAAKDFSIWLWDVASGQEVRRFTGHTAPAYGVALSRDRQHLLSGSHDKTMRLWEVANGRELGRFEGHKDTVYAVALSADGLLALSSGIGKDKSVRLWDVQTRKELRRFVGPKDDIQGLAFSSDGKFAVGGSSDLYVYLWEVESGKLLHKLAGHTNGIGTVAFSPDVRQVLSGSGDNTLRLWDREKGKEIRCFQGHTDYVQAVTFSPDGRRALSASLDETLRLWDLETGKELYCFKGHTAPVSAAAFLPDGRYAVSSSFDKTLRLWRLPDPPVAKDQP